MEGSIFAALPTVAMVADMFAAFAAVAIACLAVPCYAVRLRSAASMLGSRPPANLRSFHVHGSAARVRGEVEAFAHRNDLVIALTDELRGLIALREKPTGVMAPGMLYPIYLNQPAPDETLVSVGCVSPLAGVLIPGEFPKPDSRWQNDFMRRLAAHLVSAGHPSLPKVSGETAHRTLAPEEVQAAELEGAMLPLLRAFEVAIVAYIVLAAVVSVELLVSPAARAGFTAAGLAGLTLLRLLGATGGILYLRLAYRERGAMRARAEALRALRAASSLPHGPTPIAASREAAMPKNMIPLKTQILHGVVALALLGYGTYGIVTDKIIIPGKHNDVVLHGWAAWAVYGAMLCAVLVLVSVIVDNYDERDDERYYHLFAHFFQVLGYALFAAAMIGPMFVESPTRDMQRFLPLAERGDAEAQYQVGVYYAGGIGVRRDYGAAMAWFRKAAEQGNAAAMNYLGIMYFFGEGVPVSMDDAETWYRRAAMMGQRNAQNNLGLMYLNLQIRPADYPKGVEWLRRSAKQGHGRAMFNLAAAYEKGKGVEQDYVQAHAWFRLAGAAGVERGAKHARDLESDMSASEREASIALEQQLRKSLALPE